MKKLKYFLFSLICLFSCSTVFADSEVIIKSITPVYDEASTIVLTNEQDNYGVIFNDKNQSVKYNVVIENTSNKDLTVGSINLTSPSEDFLIYELDGLNSKDVVKANSTKEVVLSLSTVQKEGWGRNFEDELTTTIIFDSSVVNPNTSDRITILIIITLTTGFCIFIIRKNKVARYIIPLLILSSVVTFANAKESITLPIKLNVSYESQNVMKMAYTLGEMNGKIYHDYWNYISKIKKFYIENELKEIKEYAYKFDVSEKQNGRVIAYLVNNKDNTSYYDLYLQADGIICPNTNASYYFANMSNLDFIDNLNGLDTSNVTDMSYMFSDSANNSKNFTLDVSGFDTSKVTNMVSMFSFVGRENPNFTLDVSKFNTSNVTNMSNMFAGIGKSNVTFILDLSNFDTSKVTDMSYMFSRIGGEASENITLDLSSFNTSNVTNMAGMFSETGEYASNLTLDLSNFDTSKVKDMTAMFISTGRNSINFNTSITIRNTNINYFYMFDKTATKPGSQITLNYTSKTSNLVDGMIAISSNSNVVKGVQVD